MKKYIILWLFVLLSNPLEARADSLNIAVFDMEEIMGSSTIMKVRSGIEKMLNDFHNNVGQQFSLLEEEANKTKAQKDVLLEDAYENKMKMLQERAMSIRTSAANEKQLLEKRANTVYDKIFQTIDDTLQTMATKHSLDLIIPLPAMQPFFAKDSINITKSVSKKVDVHFMDFNMQDIQ